MRHVFLFLLINLVMIQKVDAECDVNLKSSDETSKFIEALHCLNQEIVRLKVKANASAEDSAAAMAAASKAAGYVKETNLKLNRILNKAMKRKEP